MTVPAALAGLASVCSVFRAFGVACNVRRTGARSEGNDPAVREMGMVPTRW